MSKEHKINEFGEIIRPTIGDDTLLKKKRDDLKNKLLNDKEANNGWNNVKSRNNESNQLVDSSGVGLWGVLYFLFPLVGIIMYFVYRSREQKKKQKQAITIAIIPIILNIIITIIENS